MEADLTEQNHIIRLKDEALVKATLGHVKKSLFLFIYRIIY